MAKVYAHPDSIQVPPITLDRETYQQKSAEFIAELKQFCIDNNPRCEHAGEELFFQMGDGSAHYMVYNYSTLILIPLDDAYDIPDAYARGLRKADIIQKIQQQKAAPTFLPLGER